MKRKIVVSAMSAIVAGLASAVNVNSMPDIGSDSERIAAALKAGAGDRIILEKRVSKNDPDRNWWLIDEAILLPSDTTLIIRDTKIKLSDKCRDNFIRSANCGLGVADIKPAKNIRIIGEGNVLLEGADRPRSTGDAEKTIRRVCAHRWDEWNKYAYWLPESERKNHKVTFWDIHNNSYGTDWNKQGESDHGDWRNIGILFAKVDNFEIKGLKMKDTHGWALSMEACTHGRIADIDFNMVMERFIDGVWQNIENQDGIDIRNGCHFITIENITGVTGDDVIALTAIAPPDGVPKKFRPSGSLYTTHVMHNDFTKRDPNISHVIIRNVRAYSRLCALIRLLPAGTMISNVIISDVIDTLPPHSVDPHNHWGPVLLLGDGGHYGKNKEKSIRYLSVNNIIGAERTKYVAQISGYVSDACFSNIINQNPECKAFYIKGKEHLTNSQIVNVVEAKGEAK